MNIWAFYRILLWSLFFIAPILGKETIENQCRDTIFEAGLFLFVSLLFPFICCAGNTVLFALSQSKEKWKRPGLKINPFKDEKPLQFYWTSSVAFICSGMGSLVSVIIFKFDLFNSSYTLQLLSSGLGGLIGIWLAMVVFKSRFEETIMS